MKNKEKYATEIAEITCNGSCVAVDKDTGNPVSCNNIGCIDCTLSNKGGCKIALKEWAESEYIEKPVISKKDRAFLDYLIEEYKFIARDRSCKLLICEAQPIKRERYWYLSNGHCLSLNRCFNVSFPMIKWEDNEPWLIEDLKKLEVCEEYEID